MRIGMGYDVHKLVETFDLNHDGSGLVVLMWKLDGSTIQLTYYQGKPIEKNVNFYKLNIPERYKSEPIVYTVPEGYDPGPACRAAEK